MITVKKSSLKYKDENGSMQDAGMLLQLSGNTENYEVDTTLTKSGVAADAKVVGDKFATMNGIAVSVNVGDWVSQDDGTYINTIAVEGLTGDEILDISLYGDDVTEEQSKVFDVLVTSVETKPDSVVLTASEAIEVPFNIIMRGKIDMGEKNVYVTELKAGLVEYDNAESKLPATNTQQAIDCLSNVSNPNLLINGDFQVNQRGFTVALDDSYVGKYLVDRWLLSWGECKITKVDNGIEIINNGIGGSPIEQRIECNPNQMIGKVMTLSASINDVVYNVSGALSTEQAIRIDESDFGMYFVFDTERNCIVVRLYANEGKTITINWAKLEQGSIATPFVPRSYGEELAMCQRYYCACNLSQLAVHRMWESVRGESFLCNIPLLTTMRTVPTFSLISFGTLYDNASDKDHQLSELDIRLRDINMMYIAQVVIRSKDSNMSAYNGDWTLSTIHFTLDSEIY